MGTLGTVGTKREKREIDRLVDSDIGVGGVVPSVVTNGNQPSASIFGRCPNDFSCPFSISKALILRYLGHFPILPPICNADIPIMNMLLCLYDVYCYCICPNDTL